MPGLTLWTWRARRSPRSRTRLRTESTSRCR
jgi:hypothetical protein